MDEKKSRKKSKNESKIFKIKEKKNSKLAKDKKKEAKKIAKEKEKIENSKDIVNNSQKDYENKSIGASKNIDKAFRGKFKTAMNTSDKNSINSPVKKIKKESSNAAIAAKYATILSIFGGLTAAITVPIVTANNKINDFRDFKDFQDGGTILDGGDSGDHSYDSDEVKKEEISNSLKDKLDESASLFFYEDEQKGSIELQKLEFRWEQLEKIFEVRDYLVEKLKLEDTKKEEEILETLTNKETHSAKISDYKAEFDSLIEKINEEAKKEETTEDDKKSFTKSADEFQKNWNILEEKIKKLEEAEASEEGINFEEDSFSTKYPVIILPKDVIRKRKEKIFDEAKNNFISSYKGEGEGEAEWIKNELSSRYNGAKNRDEALDYLVSKDIKNYSFNRFNYKLESSYSIKKIKSLIFKDIVGYIENEESGETTKNVAIPKNYELSDKSYFISSESKIINRINFNDKNNEETKKIVSSILNNRHLVQLNNVVLDIKQGETWNSPWKIGKDLVKSLFTSFGSGGSYKAAINEVGKLFTGETDEQIEEERNVIGRFTSTKDSTQWNNGNLGFMTGVDATTKMVPEFGLAVAAAIAKKDENAPSLINNADSNKPVDTKGKEIYEKILGIHSEEPTGLKLGLAKLLQDKGLLTKYIDDTTNEIDDALFLGKDDSNDIEKSQEVTSNMKTLRSLFVEESEGGISENDYVKYFGSEVRNVFQNSAESGVNGISQVYVVDDTKNVYMTVTKEYGIHLFKLNSDISDVMEEMISDLKKAANDQDKDSIRTDFPSLFMDNYNKDRQLYDLLRNDENFRKYIDEEVNIEDYKIINGKLSKDMEIMMERTIESQWIDNVGDKPESIITNLIEKFDSNLVNPNFAADPNKIYDLIDYLGGKSV